MASYSCNVFVDLRTETSGANPQMLDAGGIQVDLSDWLLTMPAERIRLAFADVENLEEAVAPYVRAEHDGPFDIDLEWAQGQVERYLGVAEQGIHKLTDADLESARERYGYRENIPEKPGGFDLRMVVAAVNAEGAGEFVPVTVNVTQEQYREGEHYDIADEKVAQSGYESRLCFDEADGPDWLFKQVHGAGVMPDRQRRLTRIDMGLDPVPEPEAPVATPG